MCDFSCADSSCVFVGGVRCLKYQYGCLQLSGMWFLFLFLLFHLQPPPGVKLCGHKSHFEWQISTFLFLMFYVPDHIPDGHSMISFVTQKTAAEITDIYSWTHQDLVGKVVECFMFSFFLTLIISPGFWHILNSHHPRLFASNRPPKRSTPQLH